MKRFILIFFIPFLMGAGTWQHRVVRTKGDKTLVEFTRDTTGEIRTTWFKTVAAESLADRIARKKWRNELGWSVLNRFCDDKGEGFPECQDVLEKLVKAIRQNPNLTLTQATTWFDNNYPDSPWKSDAVINHMRNWIEEEYGVTPTWDQFKTYVINNVILECCDEYQP